MKPLLLLLTLLPTLAFGQAIKPFSGKWQDLTGRPDLTIYLTSTAAAGIYLPSTSASALYQPLDATLTTLSGLGTTGTGSVARHTSPTFAGTVAANVISASTQIVVPGVNSTSQTTGSIVVGGVGVSGDVYCRDVVLSTGRSLILRTSVSLSSPAAGVIRTSALLENGTNGPRWVAGAGTPEGAITAPVGSMFSRTDGGAGTSFYVKESGTGNTGWVAK